MNIQQLCDYLNEIGIIDMNYIKYFLNISTQMINNNESNESISDIYKVALFTYIKKINENNKNLYFTCSNIINSYKRYIILKKYNSLFLFKKIIYLKIFERYKSFLISLYRKFPFKSYHTNIYHQNKKKKKSKIYSNNFYNEMNNKEIKDGINNEININKNLEINNNINNKNGNININNNIITFKENNAENNIKLENYKFIKELVPSKKLKKIDNNICINQSNINFEKYFINKKLIICKKNNNYISYIDRVKSNKKELYSKNPYEMFYTSLTLRKNKSETKLRVRKMLYEDKIRYNNFETINPEIRRKIKRRQKSKKEEELNDKQNEDIKFNKLIEKEIDTKNWVDRLYRQDIINKKRNEREEKKVIKKNLKKSPIDWELIYLETNDKIIKNSKEPKMNKSCSYFKPRRGRIYSYKNTIESENKEEKKIKNKNNKENNLENEKKNINMETSINNDNNKSVKISLELNSPNKNLSENNQNMVSNNAFEIKESEINSINSEKEENKEKEEQKEKDEIKNSSIFDDIDNENVFKEKMDKYKVSSLNIKSKGIQDILNKNNFNNNTNNCNKNFNDNSYNEKEEKKEEEFKSEKTDFNDLLISNNDTNNII